MPRTIRLVAAVIERDGRYLITQRRPEAVFPMLWEFPGGRVEDGESDMEALRREMLERLAVDIEVGDLISRSEHHYDGYSVELNIYRGQLLSDELRPRHVHAFHWIASEEFARYAFPPADQASMDRLLGLAGGKPS